MPLPNATYTLQGQSRPGDPMYSRPKHGMLLRLSTEAINALQSDPNAKPNVDFVVSEDGSSRIVIGESSFSLQSQTEEIPHDLYLRSASAAKPFVPLKFYANVIGKLTISERELDDELADRIRKSTAAAAEKRHNPKTKFIDANNLPQPTTKSAAKKKSDLFRKPLRPSDRLKPTPLSTSTSSAPSPRPSHAPKPPQDGTTSLGRRLIHYLALAERTSEDAVKAVGGSNCDAKTRQDILDALHLLAERGPSNKGSQQIWRLKHESWLDVRPYEWPSLSETDRTNLARGARKALSSLGIPESDPRWEHAKYRPPANIARNDSPIPAPSSLSASNSASAPKRGISSKEAREKNARKPDTKTEILIKDETKPRPNHVASSANALGSNSMKPAAKTSKAPTPPTTNGTPSTRLTPNMRRLPGSGYKLPTKAVDLSRSQNQSKDGSITPSISSSSAASKDVDVAMKDMTRRPNEDKQKDDQRLPTSRSNIKKEEGELSTSSSGTGGIGARTNDGPAPVKRVKHLRDEAMESDQDKIKDNSKGKNRERAEGRSRDTDRSRERVKDSDRGGSKERERSLERDHHRDREPTRRNSEASSQKRKKVKEEDEEHDEGIFRTGGKRRKTENGMEVLSMAGPVRGDRVNERDRDRERQRGKDNEQRDREIHRGKDKERERGRDETRERGKDRERERERERYRDRERDSPQKGRDARSSKFVNEPTTDRKSSANSQSHSGKGKTMKKEPSPPPLPAKKVKKELSPVPRHTSPISNHSNKSSSTKGAKFRRKSPIYTSSEDEDNQRHPSPALPTPTASSSSAGSRRSHLSTNDALTDGNLNEHSHEADHRNALRSKYTASYVKYLSTFQTLVSQKQEIERLLNRASSRSSDSDGDVELLDFEGLTKTLSQNKQQWEELQSIQLEHEREMLG
ncbi:hypothetical protein F5879DRAFT_978193 [Lentinula edodes]|uniref:uncharacterized protein n=1 Tax=Lentinula edodes TaxID=5353 RepID=UPI001E8E352A|nr:uncharacterized protein C8R40DRAFT_1069694 [Lentinula edodes]KAH7875239.1 hypothetical protein C8R40DRAFT_1069694 [Lentinula edodes]KAJ3899051.1 hypothetical protein F5879DRAFT_978193 [Lentinula edodes]